MRTRLCESCEAKSERMHICRDAVSFFFFFFSFFFFNDTATTEIYTLSLHDALPISRPKHWIELMNAKLIRRGRATVPTLKDESINTTKNFVMTSSI